MTSPKSQKSDDTLIGTDIIPAQEEEELPADPSHIQDPAEYVAATDELRAGYRERAREMAGDMFNARFDKPEPAVPGTIDVAKFLTAQAAYIRAQTEFMQSRRNSQEPPIPELVLREVTRFSYAQADFIEAQTEVLQQLGVI